MSSRKLNEVASDVDDASTVVEELQAEPDEDPAEKLDELKRTLEDASEALDELNEDE
jgi:regulator of sirC expression with transglutaminase-like and TPR domain